MLQVVGGFASILLGVGVEVGGGPAHATQPKTQASKTTGVLPFRALPKKKGVCSKVSPAQSLKQKWSDSEHYILFNTLLSCVRIEHGSCTRFPKDNRQITRITPKTTEHLPSTKNAAATFSRIRNFDILYLKFFRGES